MNTLKKALYIGFGVTFFILGILAAVIFAILGNLELGDKLIGVAAGLVVTIFGWWLLRRGADSVWDALSWLFIHLIP